ncbi:MAG TPA: hypothetical protein VF588_04205 [Pyrinomonadaceae bacterium]
MRRATLLFIAFAFAVACGAWRAHARAASFPTTTEASASSTRFPPVPSPTASRKIDEYGNIRWRDERVRLDNLVIEIHNDPTAVAYLVCYGGRTGRAGEARRRCERAANYLKRTQGIEPSRVVTVDGGFREELTVELWKPQAGTTMPAVVPTVDPSEVTLVSDAPRRKRPARARRVKRAHAAPR